MLNFNKKIQQIDRIYGVDEYTANETYSDTHIDLMKTLNLNGLYQVWE